MISYDKLREWLCNLVYKDGIPPSLIAKEGMEEFRMIGDKNMEQSRISTIPFGWQIETDDKVYQIKTNITVHDKHTCDECIYYDDKCLKDKNISSVERKIYCENFDDEKRCWDCEYYQSWGGDDYLCDYPDWNFDDSYEFLHEDDWNKKGKCPNFKVKL